MRLALPMTIGLAVVIAAAACGGGQAAPPPAPQPNQDSIEAERARDRARQDSIAREQARRDSIARAQAEAERLRRSREDSLAALGRETEAVRSMIGRAVHFDLDKASIRPGEDTDVLDEKLRILQANTGLTLEIVGHADERGSDEYNLALGNRRAVAAKQYLTGRGIDAGRLSTRSAGEEQPVDPGHDENAWAQNRRDEFSASGGANNLRRP